MANKKLKEKKKYARLQKVDEIKKSRRLFKARQDRADKLERIKIDGLRDRVAPIIKEEDPQEIEKKIKKNLELLEALEKEYIETQKNKENLHKELEAEGYKTLEEKIEALKNKARQNAGVDVSKFETEKMVGFASKGPINVPNTINEEAEDSKE